MRYARALAVALCIQLALAQAAGIQAPAPTAALPAPAAQAPVPGRGRGPVPVDPRAQIRMHRFAETNEEIVSLHGLGGTHTTMMRPNAIDLAEAGGYILLAPMGYNPRGWYGIPAGPRRGGPPPTPTATAAPANTTPAIAPPANAGRQGAGRGALAVVHGDMDTVVPVALSRPWVEVMKALKMPHQYIEVAGGDHGSVISSHQAEVFAFFAKYSK